MSAKNRDNKNRWRNITVGFRVSPEENELINKAVALSGLPKLNTISLIMSFVEPILVPVKTVPSSNIRNAFIYSPFPFCVSFSFL